MPSTPPPTMPDAATLWSSNDRALDMARAVLGAADAAVGLTPKELVWRKNKARLYRYVRSEPATHQTPIFLVLPLINRAYILDLRPGASFVDGVEPIDDLIDLFLEPDDELTEPSDVFAGRHVHRLEVGPHVLAHRFLGGKHRLEHLSARLAELVAAHRLLER